MDNLMGFCKKFFEWSTINNWKDAVDILFKLTAIIGAIALASFFEQGPEISMNTAWTFTSDSDLIVETYDRYNKNKPFSPDSEFDFNPQNINKLISDCPKLTWYFWAFGGDSKPNNAMTQKIRDYPDITEMDEEQFACHAYAVSLSTTATVIISNKGRGTAKNIEISTSEEFFIVEGETTAFDLPYKASKTLIFQNISFEESMRRKEWKKESNSMDTIQNEFIPRWDSSLENNVPLIRWTAVSLFVIWLFIVIVDIKKVSIESN